MCIIAHTNFTSRTKIFNSYRGRALAGYLSVTEWQQVERCDFVWSRFFFESHGICCLSWLPLSAFDCSFSFAVCVSWPLTSSVRVPTWQYKCLLEQHKVMWCEVCMCVCACVTVQTSDRFQDLQRAPVVSLISSSFVAVSVHSLQNCAQVKRCSPSWQIFASWTLNGECRLFI